MKIETIIAAGVPTLHVTLSACEYVAFNEAFLPNAPEAGKEIARTVYAAHRELRRSHGRCDIQVRRGDGNWTDVMFVQPLPPSTRCPHCNAEPLVIDRSFSRCENRHMWRTPEPECPTSKDTPEPTPSPSPEKF